MSEKSKTLLTKHGIKGKSISFDIEGRNEFINGFRTRKKERNAKNSAKKKLKEKKFIEDVKKDAKEAVRSHVKTINRFCRQKGESRINTKNRRQYNLFHVHLSDSKRRHCQSRTQN